MSNNNMPAEQLNWPFLAYYYRKPLGDTDPNGVYTTYDQAPKFNGGAMHERVQWASHPHIECMRMHDDGGVAYTEHFPDGTKYHIHEDGSHKVYHPAIGQWIYPSSPLFPLVELVPDVPFPTI